MTEKFRRRACSFFLFSPRNSHLIVDKSLIYVIEIRFLRWLCKALYFPNVGIKENQFGNIFSITALMICNGQLVYD